MGFQNLLEIKDAEPGIGENVFVAPAYWFAKNGIKKAGANTVIISDDHVFLEGKGFIKISLAPRKNKLSALSIGDMGLNKLGIELEIFVPGSYAQLHEQVKNLLNVPLIVLCYDNNCPIEFYYNLGSEEEPCYLTVDFSTGYTQDGVIGYAGKIVTTSTAVWLYEGLIQKPEDVAIITETGSEYILTEDGRKIYIE